MEALEVTCAPNIKKGCSSEMWMFLYPQHYVKPIRPQYFFHFRITSIFFLPHKYVLPAH